MLSVLDHGLQGLLLGLLQAPRVQLVLWVLELIRVHVLEQRHLNALLHVFAHALLLWLGPCLVRNFHAFSHIYRVFPVA